MHCELRALPFSYGGRLWSDWLSHGLCSRRGSPGTARAFASRRAAPMRGFRPGVAELGVRPIARLMPKRRFRKSLLCFIAFLCIALYTATRGNVRWRVQLHYPNAEVDLRAEGNQESSLVGDLCRSVGIRYFGPSETVGIRICGHPTAIDFTHFRSMLITYLRLEHCVITDIRPLLMTYRPEVSFITCDISSLPDDQKRFLHHQPEFDRYSIYILDGAIPYSFGNENFYP